MGNNDGHAARCDIPVMIQPLISLLKPQFFRFLFRIICESRGVAGLHDVIHNIDMRMASHPNFFNSAYVSEWNEWVFDFCFTGQMQRTSYKLHDKKKSWGGSNLHKGGRWSPSYYTTIVVPTFHPGLNHFSKPTYPLIKDDWYLFKSTFKLLCNRHFSFRYVILCLIFRYVSSFVYCAEILKIGSNYITLHYFTLQY